MEFLGMVEILKEETPVSWRVPVSWKKILFDEVQNKIIIPCSQKNLIKIQVMVSEKGRFVIKIKSLKEFIEWIQSKKEYRDTKIFFVPTDENLHLK